MDTGIVVDVVHGSVNAEKKIVLKMNFYRGEGNDLIQVDGNECKGRGSIKGKRHDERMYWILRSMMGDGPWL